MSMIAVKPNRSSRFDQADFGKVFEIGMRPSRQGQLKSPPDIGLVESALPARLFPQVASIRKEAHVGCRGDQADIGPRLNVVPDMRRYGADNCAKRDLNA